MQKKYIKKKKNPKKLTNESQLMQYIYNIIIKTMFVI